EHEDRPKLDRTGVAKLLEHAACLAGDQRRLNVELDPLADVAREGMQIAGALGRETADSEAVRSAIEERRFRARYASDRRREMLVDRTIMVDTEGAVVGQINGLTVMSSSGYGFGAPVRITARTFAGRGGIVDIEREVELGGPLHSKGVFILYGYLGGVYGQDHPLSLSSSLVFEQTYSPVEGDSASLGELCALLSSLSDLPLRQDLAVTGSVNQRGEVQAIGGINEKIEGFFDLCAERGLTGEQGVVFPQANAPNLMLREDVVEAVAAGSFHVYPVETVDEAITLFTGVPAGEHGDAGEDTVHGRVRQTLGEFSESTRWWAER
ncbi:MAG: Lon-insertion domain-containing protein, partial [Chloroflexota bacterium]